MFGPPGTAYIHLNFGIHWCLNAVVGPRNYPAAVLLRAVEPIEGLEIMRRRRDGRSDRELTSGPARLTRALGVGPELQRHPLSGPPLFIADGTRLPASALVVTTRIGISRGAEKQWRFYDSRSAWVSRPARKAGASSTKV
jgi:DNA-3-methyladenine glycosylase